MATRLCWMRGFRRAVAVGLVAALLAYAAGPAYALPTGGAIQAGSGQIGQPTGSQLTVTQSSDKLIIDWTGFSIAPGEQVTFVQPGASSVALNRVTGNSRSEIAGTLTANGQVFLVNPHGVVFGPTAQVNVGALVASTLNLQDGDFLAGRYTFTGDPGAGSIALETGARVQAADGGYVALVAPRITNDGTIAAQLGTVALGAAGAATLNLLGDGQVDVVIDAPAAGARIDQQGELIADGGLVVLRAGSEADWAGAVLNQTGITRAQALEDRDGRVVLSGGDVRLGGRLEAAGDVDVRGGEVRIDAPLTVAAGEAVRVRSDGDITFGAAASVRGGGGTDVLLRADAHGTGVGTVRFEPGTMLHLEGAAVRIHYNPETPVFEAKRSGDMGRMAASTSQAAASSGFSAAGGFSTTDFAPFVSGGVLSSWVLINSLQDLNNVRNNLSGQYILGRNIDASQTRSWSGGFTPIGTYDNPFVGEFEGDGYSINGLYIASGADGNWWFGLFGVVGEGAYISNFVLDDVLIQAPAGVQPDRVGAVAGQNHGRIVGVDVTGEIRVPGGAYDVGGLVGRNYGFIASSSAAVDIAGGVDGAGGLVGFNDIYGRIERSHASGNIDVLGDNVGGLVGRNQGLIERSYATGDVVGGSAVGGLVGLNQYGSTHKPNDQTPAVIRESYATGSVSGTGYVGGLVGHSGKGAPFQTERVIIERSFATGNVY